LLDLLGTDHSDHPVAAWHRPGLTPRAQTGVAWEAVDVLDRDAVRRSIATLRPAAVYHCAGAAHVGRAWEQVEQTFATNVRGTHHLLDALRETGAPARVLIPSSALVYAAANDPIHEDNPVHPRGPYGVSKLAQELIATAADGLVAAVARAFNHIGSRQDPTFAASGFAQRIAEIEAHKTTPEIAVGNLEARRDLTDVRDTVRAYRAILERGHAGCVYNVCSGRAYRIGDLLDMMLTRARVPIRIKTDPDRYRPVDDPVIVGDGTRIRRDLGWAPAIPFEQTIDDLLAYWRAQYKS
jgi:GDP-4-dehydro-6-deoxy-D-mannose reductase